MEEPKVNSKTKEQMLRKLLGEGKKIYVSVTGLSLKKPWHILHFLRFAIPAKIQSENAPGNLFSETRNIDGVKHTLSYWVSKKDMLTFAHSGHHKKAIAAFSKFFVGVTYGFEANHPITWEEALELLEKHGRAYKGTSLSKE